MGWIKEDGLHDRDVFDTLAEAEAFKQAIVDGVRGAFTSAERLGTKGGPLGTWKTLANDLGALSSKDTFTWKDTLADSVDNNPIFSFTGDGIREQNAWTIRAQGEGVGGNATAKFNTEYEAKEFEELVDALIGLGLADELF